MSDAAVLQQPAEAAVGWEHDYRKLIEEVYIDPIRSVVVVDDEFPTLDAFVKQNLVEKSAPQTSNESVEAIKSASTSASTETQLDAKSTQVGSAAPADDIAFSNIETVRDILSFCRERERPWLVDVHDGREVKVNDEINIASHLHHSDLMILDYHLAGQSGGGDKAIKILKKLAKSPHFNLVAIYTRGYQGDDFQKVFYEIATSINFKEFRFLSEDEFRRVEDAIGDWELQNEEISKILSALISNSLYLEERSKSGAVLEGPIGQRVKNLLDADQYRAVRAKEVIPYLLQVYHDNNLQPLSDENYGDVHLSFNEQINWIKTDSLFVTVVHKKQNAKGIEEQIKNALFHFCPDPHQLLMAKMRTQIDETGVIAETAVLSNKYMQAGWLSDIFDQTTNNSQIIKGTVDRHWEALGDQLREDIDSFADRLITNVLKRGEVAVMAKYAAVIRDEEDTILQQINLYNSTKPVSHSHLMTGHILQLPDEHNAPSPNLWVCLSPACDLVPGQKLAGWRGKLGDKLPFMAVQLNASTLNVVFKYLQHNIHLFLEIKGEIKTFTFCPDGTPQSNPLWEQMFVSNKGKFVDRSNKLSISRVYEDNGNLVTKTVDVEVVAQLRYEYALNLLQRLGGSFSRIGLDFKSRRVRS